MRTFRRFLIVIIAILIFPAVNSQDITGDWFGKLQIPDSLSVNLHIYKDKERLNATLDSPDQLAFGIPVDEITSENDTLFLQISGLSLTYKGHINQDYSIIDGNLIQYGNKDGLDFGRTRLVRTNRVNDSSLTVLPAKVRVVKSGNPQKIPYTGNRVVEAGTPEVKEIDTSKLKVLTPGKDTISHPIIYKFPDPVTQAEYPVQTGNSLLAPIIVRAKQTEPVPVQPMRMKDAACFNIQYLDLDQGLVDPEIWSILDDAKGNLWFGSLTGGICRYDGEFLTYYNIKEGLTHSGNRAMMEDRSGNIWIGTDWGLCKYDGKYITQYSGYVFFSIKSILETDNGNIWIGTSNGAIEKKGNIWTHYTENQGLINNMVNSICEDKNGNLWFGTDQGVCKYDGISFIHFTENEGLVSIRVRSVMEDKSGNLWFGTLQGVSKYDGKSFRQYTVKEGLSSNSISSIIEDSNGYLWIGTWGGGVDMYDGKTFTHYTTGDGLNNNDVTSVIEDNCRNIWLTTFGGGVMKLNRNSFMYSTHLLEDIGKSKVTSIIEDPDGNIWFGFLSGEGLIKYNGDSFTVMKRDEGLDNISIRSMLEDKDGNIWFTNDNNPALQKYDGKSFTIYDNKEIWNSAYGECMHKDKEGNIWVGTWGEGIIKFDGVSFTSFPFPGIQPPYNSITSILQDRKGNFWFGTLAFGLIKYDGEFITKYHLNEGLSDIRITSLFEDKNGNIWIGTEDGGVNQFDGVSFTYFTEKEGLSNNYVSSVIEDKKGNIWVGTKRGLSLLSPQEADNYSVTTFDTNDGLKELDFNGNAVCLDSRNRLWWGTGNIVTMLDLDRFEIIPEPPVIQLNTINLNDEFIDFGILLAGIEEAEPSLSDTTHMKMRGLKFSDVAPFYNYPLDLELPHNMNHLTFNFSATEWTAPQSIRYQYMLEGMDEQWSPLSEENQADYRNIPPGEYKFKLKAISKTKIWSETFEYPFTIRRPWWFRWWAYTFYAMVLILLARYYVRYIISRERIKAEIQIKQVEVDKMQELDQMKSRFFANISHEFRTPLTLLLGPVEDSLKKGKGEIKVRRDILEIMQRNGKRLQKLINQLLDISKLETGKVSLQVSTGNLEEFVRTIILSFLSLAESKHIRYEYDLPETNLIVYFDGGKLEKILTNLISNAFKFTPADGEINVSLRYITSAESDTLQNVEIKVIDTGMGIPSEKIDRIFERFYQVSDSNIHEEEGTGIGLALTGELVDLYRGEIHVESEVGRGSTFSVRLPVLKEQFKDEEIVAVTQDREGRMESAVKGIGLEESERSEITIEEDHEKAKDTPVILVVEDNIDLRNYISRNLGNSYQIMVAENGKTGLSGAIENIPDLVISDVMMPEMDGMEMCHRLKTDERTNHIPVIMLTARADRGSKLEGLETGADDYIIKPFDTEELSVRVRNLIAQRKRLRDKFRKEFVSDPIDMEVPYEDQFLNKLSGILDQYVSEPDFKIDHLVDELHMSRAQVFRKINAITGYTPNDLIRSLRLKKAASLFRSGHKHIAQVMHQVGFNSQSYFGKCFHELYGMTPSEYIKQKRS